MPRFLSTKGNTYLTVGVCQRCQRKFPIGELYDDPNIRGMKVCKDDIDNYDPYRLAARQPDVIVPPFVRPDQRLDAGPGTTPNWAQQPKPTDNS